MRVVAERAYEKGLAIIAAMRVNSPGNPEIMRASRGLSWDPNADINNDGRTDLSILIRYFGQRWS